MVDLGVPTKAEAKDMITQRLASIQNVVLGDYGAHLLPLEKNDSNNLFCSGLPEVMEPPTQITSLPLADYSQISRYQEWENYSTSRIISPLRCKAGTPETPSKDTVPQIRPKD